jgi:hypothetical protein
VTRVIIVCGLLGDSLHRESGDSQQHHLLTGFWVECDGLEASQFARTIGSANSLAPRLLGTAGDTLRDQAASDVALLGFLSKRDLHFFKELLPL